MKATAKIIFFVTLLLPPAVMAGTVPEIDVEKIFAEKKALIKEAYYSFLYKFGQDHPHTQIVKKHFDNLGGNQG